MNRQTETLRRVRLDADLARLDVEMRAACEKEARLNFVNEVQYGVLPDNREDDTLGPCGCTDYHMSDCPTPTGGDSRTMDEMLEDFFEDRGRLE